VSTGGKRGPVAGFGLGVSPFDYAVKQCEAVLHSVRLCLWPNPLVVDHGESLAVTPGVIWLQAALLFALVAATVIGVWRRHAFGFLGAWFFVILSPSSSVVPLLTQTIAEHRLYLPLAAPLVLATLVLARALQHGRTVVAFGVIGALTLVTFARNRVYAHPINIWRDTVAKAPNNSRAHYNLGVELARQPGRADAAIACFEQSLRCKPTDAAAHYGLAKLLAEKPDRRRQAIAHYEAALQITPGHSMARVNLANELAANPDRLPEAIAHYQIALQAAPNSSIAYNNLANALARVPGREADALVNYERALQLQPSDAEVHFNLGNLLGRLARAPEALRHYRRAVELRPAFTPAHYQLANLLAASPDGATEAITHYRTVITLEPDHLLAHYNLGVVYANGQRIRDAIAEFKTVLNLDPESVDARDNLKMLEANLSSP
jgi:protein O-mannosyl-transferase